MKTDDELIVDTATTIKVTGEEVPYDDAFSYDGYQVVSGEFFAHINEPTITFNGNKVYVNMACIKRLPEVERIQILIKKEERSLVIRPSNEEEKESFVWCSRGLKRTPKQVTGKEFMELFFEFTGWNPDNRYKLLGKIFRNGNEVLFKFELDSKMTFPRTKTDDGQTRTSRHPVFTIASDKPFGPSYAEHRKQMESRVFKGYQVLRITDDKKEKVTKITTEANSHGDKSDE